MKTQLKNGEELIKQGPANLQKGIEAVGGHLFLTNQRLIFEAHKFNRQGGNTEINLLEVKSLAKGWTKFLGIIPLMPNSLVVQTEIRKKYRFVLFDRTAWIRAIQEQLQSKKFVVIRK